MRDAIWVGGSGVAVDVLPRLSAVSATPIDGVLRGVGHGRECREDGVCDYDS